MPAPSAVKSTALPPPITLTTIDTGVPRMPKKPTNDYGSIDFGADCGVTKNMSRLGDSTKGQEEGVGERFIDLSDLPAETKLLVLPETDHDLRFEPPGSKPWIVECTEVALRELFLPEGSSSTFHHVMDDGTAVPVDVEKRNNILLHKIEAKLAKHYSKPVDAQFVLLIWTVSSHVDLPLLSAIEFAKANGVAPFDRVYFFNMLTRPQIIWP